jgi:hypothetical protein
MNVPLDRLCANPMSSEHSRLPWRGFDYEVLSSDHFVAEHSHRAYQGLRANSYPLYLHSYCDFVNKKKLKSEDDECESKSAEQVIELDVVELECS